MSRIVNAQDLDLASVLRSGDGVLWGQAGAEPQTLVEKFTGQRAAFSGCSAFLGVNTTGIVRPVHADHLRLMAYCGAGHNRALSDAGVLEILPVPYSRIADLIRTGRIRADVVFVQVSPANAQGEHSLGLSVEYLPPAIASARAVIAEINDQVPWTYGDGIIHSDAFALAVNVSRPPALGNKAAPGELERRIAAHAAPYVPDAATLEFGLGALPDAVLQALGGHRDLAVHSGALGDGIVDLIRAGVITNARKPFDQGVSVGGILLGSRKLLDFAHQNPSIHLRSIDHTHDPRVLGQLPRFAAINSAVEVDLTGQVNAEVANGSYVGAVGGALDFIRAANQSPGGVSLVILPSSVGTRVSRIVSRLSGPVSTPRGEAGVIVTEHGAADLRGCTLRERARRMLSISHPAFREALEREAREAGLA